MTLYQLRIDLGAVREMITTLMEEITEVENPPRPVKNGKPPVRKPRTVKAAKATWTLDAKRRGRVPNWVLNQYRSLNKAALLAKFKDGHKFVKV